MVAPIFFDMNKGKIHRSLIIGSFTKVANELIRSKLLTMQEKSILIFILTHPEDWSINRQYLYNSFIDSKGSIDTAFKGLIAKGYIHSYKIMSDKGRFLGLSYEVFETPKTYLPRDGKPGAGKPPHGESETGQTGGRITEARKSSPIHTTEDTKTEHTNTDLIKTNVLTKASENFSIENVRLLFTNQGKPEQADTFFYHYESLNWMVAGTPIVKLEALVSKWILNNQNKPTSNGLNKQHPANSANTGVTRFDETANEFLRSIGEL
jgi:hypothetical protein